MRFRVKRTSQLLGEQPPIPQAIEELHTYTSTLGPGIDRKWFQRTGRNHRELPDGRFQREIDEPIWTININSLEELLALVRELNCECVVGIEYDMPTIEIYDDYRE